MHWFQYVNNSTCGNYNMFTLKRVSGVNIKTQQLPVCPFKHCVYTYIRMFLCDVVSVLTKGTTTKCVVSAASACAKGKWGPQCSRLCNCESPTTTCDPGSGCAKCPPGFTGGDCYEDLNECDTNPCGANANCTNSVGTFRCDCHAGYVQENPTKCVGMYTWHAHLIQLGFGKLNWHYVTLS